MAERSLPDKPYKFLDSYDFEDTGIFFGRDRETRILVSDVLVNRLVVLFARTGTGKTSVINAGVRPRLEQRGFKTYFVRVHRDPADSARKEIEASSKLQALSGDLVVNQVRRIVRALSRNQLAGQMENVVKILKKPIVLFFDQFEEFFIYTYWPDPAKGQAFIAEVAQLYRNREAGVHLVFSMREDFFVEMDAFRDEIPTIFHNDSNLRLRRFDQSQARDAIVHPARAFGAHYAPELVERLLHDLSAETGIGAGSEPDGRIEPAQLQIVCDTLWERRTSGEITVDQYEALGRGGAGNVARQVLYDRLEQVFDEIQSPDQLALLARLLPELRTKEGTKYVRDVEGLATALGVGSIGSDRALGELLRQLEKVRFVRRGQRDSLEIVELSHDYLVGHLDELSARVRLIWPRRKLREAFDRYRASEALATPEQLEAIAAEVERLELTPEEAEFLFRSGLEFGYHEELWFRIASERGVQIWDLLGRLFDGGGSIPALENAIDLCEQQLRADDGSGRATRKRAMKLLGDALLREDLTLATQETLARLIGIRGPWISRAATDRLFVPLWVSKTATALLLGHLDGALEHKRVASSALAALGRIEQTRSVGLLVRALGRHDLNREAQEALARLMGARRAKVAAAATDALSGFIERNIKPGGLVSAAALRALGRVETVRCADLLARSLEVPELAPEAKLALEQLSRSKVADVAELASSTLSLGFETGAAAAAVPPDPYSSGVPPQERVALRRAPRPSRGDLDSTLLSIATSVKKGECLLVLGRGVHAPPPESLASLYPDAERPPLSAEMAHRLAKKVRYEARYPGDSTYDFRRVAQYCSEVLGHGPLVDMIANFLAGKKPSPMLRALAQLPFQIVLTTNVDSLLEQALQAAGKHPVVVPFDPEAGWGLTREDFLVRRVVPDNDRRPQVFKLFGDLTDPRTPLLTEDDLIDFAVKVAGEEERFRFPVMVRRAVVRHWPIFLIGLNLRSLDTRFLLRTLIPTRGERARLFALVLHPDPLVAHGLENRFHARLIDEDLWSFVPELYRAVTGEALLDLPH